MREIKVGLYGYPMRQAEQAGVLARVIFRPHEPDTDKKMVIIDPDVRPGTHLLRAAESGAVAPDYNEAHKTKQRAEGHTDLTPDERARQMLEDERAALNELAIRNVVDVELPEPEPATT